MAVPVTLVAPNGDRLRASAWQVDGLWVIQPVALPRPYGSTGPLHAPYWTDMDWDFDPPLESFLAAPS